MPVRFLITAEAYRLIVDTTAGQPDEVAMLAGGATALLPAGRVLDEASLEKAIERAEDWLMPHARRLQGEVLEVRDETARLERGLDEVFQEQRREWTLDAFEGIFLRVVDLVTARRATSGARIELFVADVLVVRELAHHGQVRRIHLRPTMVPK